MAAEYVIVKAPCNECGCKTNHRILKERAKTISDDEEGLMWYKTTYRMIECMGCHFISLERLSTSFEDQQDDPPKREYFPPPISRRMPSWIDDLWLDAPARDDGLPNLLEEVYSALHANNRRLAAMGARALLDVGMVDAVGDVGGFGKKLQELENKGIIGKQQREFLDAALETGNAAAHRGHCPKAKQLNHVMDIVENVLHQIYILPHAVTELKKSTPPRKRSVK